MIKERLKAQVVCCREKSHVLIVTNIINAKPF
jgi:hypothetical protein